MQLSEVAFLEAHHVLPYAMRSECPAMRRCALGHGGNTLFEGMAFRQGNRLIGDVLALKGIGKSFKAVFKDQLKSVHLLGDSLPLFTHLPRREIPGNQPDLFMQSAA